MIVGIKKKKKKPKTRPKLPYKLTKAARWFRLKPVGLGIHKNELSSQVQFRQEKHIEKSS